MGDFSVGIGLFVNCPKSVANDAAIVLFISDVGKFSNKLFVALLFRVAIAVLINCFNISSLFIEEGGGGGDEFSFEFDVGETVPSLSSIIFENKKGRNMKIDDEGEKTVLLPDC